MTQQSTKNSNATLNATLNATFPDMLAEADLCIRCGYCLNACPSYNILKDENDSPRGRIQRIKSLANGNLTLENNHHYKLLNQHLDRCLQCRQCETKCTANVPIVDLITQTKAILNEHRSPDNNQTNTSKTVNWLMLSFKNPKLRYWLLQKLSLANTFGGLNKLASLPILPKTVRSLIANIPRPTQSWPAFKSFYPATKSAISIFGQQGKINLFPGCLGISIDPQTVRSSIFVLNNLGYDVLLENKHQCCGALHHHAGIKLNKNQQYNAKESNTYPILTLHSGCQSFIEHNSNSNAVNKHVDVLSFLKNHAKQLDYIFNQRLKKQNLDTQSYQDELKSTILSQPCTESSTIDQTLSLIFNTKINSVKDGCCGNAGTYFLRQPDIAQQLTKQRITKLLAYNPKRIWTSNLGCAIAIKGHIATSKSLKSKVNNVIVEHPITTIHQFML